jgi:hypothetical protein
MGRARYGTNSTVVDFALSTFAARDSTNLNMLAKCRNGCLRRRHFGEFIFHSLQALDRHAALYLL